MGSPSYSVLPDARRYPCFTWDGRMEPVEDEDGGGTTNTKHDGRTRFAVLPRSCCMPPTS